MKKLVRIDPRSGRIIDIDQEKLRTVANELLEYLDVELDSNDDIHGVKNSFYPLCNEALSGKILESISPDLLPLEYQRRERVFTEKLNRLLARFCVTICGISLEKIEIEDVKDVSHAYINIETSE